MLYTRRSTTVNEVLTPYKEHEFTAPVGLPPVTANKQPEIPSRYRVDKTIGSGGMGIVYKAHDTYLDKDVAIKMLLIPNLDQKLLTRFQREAKVASSLNHLNLITVLDFGVTGDGKPYMVMDYAEGTTLSELLEQETSLTIERSLPIFMQICEGLSHAHSKGVFHRDLKPGNVILTDSDSEIPLVRIVDFGLAKPTNPDGHSTLTEVGAVLGSPLYMSPEQAMSREVDHRTDIYSMGCLMYKTLTGRAPIEGDTALETLSAKCTNVAPRLDKNEFPGLLTDIVARCLSIAPEARFQTTDELLSALNELGDELSIAPIPIVATVEPPKKVRSKAGLLAICAIVISAVAAVSVFFSINRTNEQTAPQLAKDSTAESKAELDKLEKTTIPDAKFSPTGKSAFQLCGISEEDENDVKISKMEKYLEEHPGVYSFNICNELRHIYLATSETKSMEYVDIILKNEDMNRYALDVISDWKIAWSKGSTPRRGVINQEETPKGGSPVVINLEQTRKRDGKAVIKLEQTRKRHSNFKYLNAACSIIIGDLQLRMKEPYLAKSSYLRVSKSQDDDLKVYRDLANSRLKRL